MSFSENLKNIRAEKKLSQEQLAELLGVSRQAVSKWEQDSSYPETEKLIQIAIKLNVSLDSLLLDKEVTQKANEQLQNKQVIYSPDKKIAIQSFDGKAMSAFYKFIITSVGFPAKDEPKCVIMGIDSTSFWGDNQVLLGWYETIDNAKCELDEIHYALKKGESTYCLKYYAHITSKYGSPKIVKDKN